MGLVDDTRVRALVIGFFLSLVALTLVASFGLLAVLSALTGPTGGSLLFVVLEAAAPYLVASMLVGLLSFLLLVGLAVAAVRRASVPSDERLAGGARLIERASPAAREADLAERFEPTVEDRIADLKDAYVAGEVSELEYERRLEGLLEQADLAGERSPILDEIESLDDERGPESGDEGPGRRRDRERDAER
ncbi:hypothetical protein BRC82_04300 [Halobacteriales archaeon QS_1_67_19]|nr:MAG: hypothetical protein BRC82_04300 [Halobacteriales archaeon QS_1_67_19]